MKIILTIVSMFAVLFGSGCVSTGRYKRDIQAAKLESVSKYADAVTIVEMNRQLWEKDYRDLWDKNLADQKRAEEERAAFLVAMEECKKSRGSCKQKAKPANKPTTPAPCK